MAVAEASGQADGICQGMTLGGATWTEIDFLVPALRKGLEG